MTATSLPSNSCELKWYMTAAIKLVQKNKVMKEQKRSQHYQVSLHFHVTSPQFRKRSSQMLKFRDVTCVGGGHCYEIVKSPKTYLIRWQVSVEKSCMIVKILDINFSFNNFYLGNYPKALFDTLGCILYRLYIYINTQAHTRDYAHTSIPICTVYKINCKSWIGSVNYNCVRISECSPQP